VRIESVVILVVPGETVVITDQEVVAVGERPLGLQLKRLIAAVDPLVEPFGELVILWIRAQQVVNRKLRLVAQSSREFVRSKNLVEGIVHTRVNRVAILISEAR